MFRLKIFSLLIFCLFTLDSAIAKSIESPCSEEVTVAELLSLSMQSIEDASCNGEILTLEFGSNKSNSEIILNLTDTNIHDKYSFSGLAFYYNNNRIFIAEGEELKIVNPGDAFTLNNDSWFSLVGRFNVLLISFPSATGNILNDKIKFTVPTEVSSPIRIAVLDKPFLGNISTELNSLRYSHLWGWLSALAMFIEYVLETLHGTMFSNWGVVIIAFAILYKLILLPLDIYIVGLQRNISKYDAILVPKLEEIKKKYDGEEAHNMIMEAHKSLGITPFYTMKPMVGSFVKVPILVATFNALGEMPQFLGSTFLWIDDLAYPDVLSSLSFSIPMFGDKISALPFIMTLVTIVSTVVYKDSLAPISEVKKKKINLYLMAIAFFVLFYPFPAVMVLFWVIVNFLQAIQQQFIKV